MYGFKKLVKPAVMALILGACWVGVAQVQDKQKDKLSPAKKTLSGVKKQGVDSSQTPTAAGTTAPAKEKAAKQPTADHQRDAGDETADQTAIRQSALAFVTAYNAHDANAVSELFALKAEFTDEDGILIQGREAIGQDFSQMFAEYPDCTIQIAINSIRILTPHVALEEGVVRGQPAPDLAETVSGYVVVHVKVDGQWRIASVSDVEADASDLTANDHLQELAWMVGDWIDESPDSVVKSSCRWDETGNYLLHEFVLQIAGVGSASGSMRIGWDPLTRQLKSWTFDADSGYSEGLWIRVGDEWMVKSLGVNAAGEATTAVSIFKNLDHDTMSWRAYDRTAGGKPAMEVPENVIKRRAPPPEG